MCVCVCVSVCVSVCLCVCVPGVIELFCSPREQNNSITSGEKLVRIRCKIGHVNCIVNAGYVLLDVYQPTPESTATRSVIALW